MFYYIYYDYYYGNVDEYNYTCAVDENIGKFVDIFMYVFDYKFHGDFDNKFDK